MFITFLTEGIIISWLVFFIRSDFAVRLKDLRSS